MIVFEDRQLVIITPPHTASGNVHRALCNDQFGGRWCVGPNPDGEPDHHYATLATAWKDWQVAVVIRHPLDRMIGLYEHHRLLSETEGWDPVPFWMWTGMVLSDHPDLSWFYKWTITRLVAPDLLQQASLLRFESLATDLSGLIGEPVALSSGWSVDHAGHLADISSSLLLQWHGRKDRRLGNYEPLV